MTRQRRPGTSRARVRPPGEDPVRGSAGARGRLPARRRRSRRQLRLGLVRRTERLYITVANACPGCTGATFAAAIAAGGAAARAVPSRAVPALAGPWPCRADSPYSRAAGLPARECVPSPVDAERVPLARAQRGRVDGVPRLAGSALERHARYGQLARVELGCAEGRRCELRVATLSLRASGHPPIQV